MAAETRGPQRAHPLAYAVLVAAALACLVPVAWLLWLAATESGAAARAGGSGTALDNLLRAVGRLDLRGRWLFGRQLLNSLLVSGTTALVAVAVAAPAAHALARLRFPGRRPLLALLFVLPLLPVTAVAVPARLLSETVGLAGSLTTVVLLQLAVALPLCTTLLWARLRALPVEPEEAALLEGASPRSVLWRVALPQVRGSLFAAAALSFVAAWNEYVLAARFLPRDAVRTLPVALGLLAGTPAERGVFAAGALVVSVPSLLLLFAFRRQLLLAATRFR